MTDHEGERCGFYSPGPLSDAVRGVVHREGGPCRPVADEYDTECAVCLGPLETYYPDEVCPACKAREKNE